MKRIEFEWIKRRRALALFPLICWLALRGKREVFQFQSTHPRRNVADFFSVVASLDVDVNYFASDEKSTLTGGT